jgi:hypothetical protein
MEGGDEGEDEGIRNEKIKRIKIRAAIVIVQACSRLL